MKDKSVCVAIKELVGLKPDMCSFLIDDSSKHNKGLNENVVEKKTHSEYKDLLLNKKGLGHLIIRIQSKVKKLDPMKLTKFKKYICEPMLLDC